MRNESQHQQQARVTFISRHPPEVKVFSIGSCTNKFGFVVLGKWCVLGPRNPRNSHETAKCTEGTSCLQASCAGRWKRGEPILGKIHAVDDLFCFSFQEKISFRFQKRNGADEVLKGDNSELLGCINDTCKMVLSKIQMNKHGSEILVSPFVWHGNATADVLNWDWGVST